jgi:biopolymer transport protein ExbB/TolQ
MKKLFKEGDFPKDFFFQIGSLFISIIFVHTIFLLFIDPAAAMQIELASNQNRAPDRTIAIILKDFEQETCIMLAIWALSIMWIKWTRVKEQTSLLLIDVLGTDSEESISFSRIEKLKDNLALSSHGLLKDSLLAGLQTFIVTKNIHEAASSSHLACDQEADRMESELSMIRYIIWAIPSIGFIGTVRGIGEALSQAHIAVEGDIAGMTASLGVAFNSTFVALVVSIFLMFFLHQLQLIQDLLVLDTHEYCNKNFLNKLQ